MVRVVAAALLDARRGVLLADRPVGKDRAGRWEFPGGKVGEGETERAALERELREELGIEVRGARHSMRLAHDYPDRRVELSFWIVEHWEGEPRPLDGQRLEWVPGSRLGEWDILEADSPFVEQLQRMKFEIRNPRTGQNDFTFEAPSPIEVQGTALALRAAQPAWHAAGLAHRIEVLQRWKAVLATHRGAIVDALAIDTGRRVIAGSEFGAMVGAIDRWCALAPTLLVEARGQSRAVPSVEYVTQLVPFALVSAISPWNFPYTLALIDALPALLAGCAVYVKPSEVTPRWTVPFNRALAQVPELAAVFALQPGGREMGEALVAASDAVCFTGSVKTGRAVAANAASHFVTAFLELGGKDPVIVTATADVAQAAETVLRASCTATGQACQSLERVYVDRRIHDRFVAELVARAQAVTLTLDDPARGILGPFIWANQAPVVEAQVEDAVRRGAKLLTGGRIERRGGEWMRPTVLVGVTHEMRIMAEETFGPVMPVMPYDTIDEAIAFANSGEFGLSAAVIAGSLEEAEAIARRIDAGAVSLNDGALTAFVHDVEKNSFKLSGLGGSRMGPSGFLRFFRRKAILRQTGRPLSLGALAEEGATQA